MSSLTDQPKPGLRERKKAKTRAAIQHAALELIRQQGYEATTIEQIVEAAEVSESTFYRYFPTKQDLVLTDEMDPLIAAAFRAQPPELGVMQAMRRAVRSAAEALDVEEVADLRQRTVVMFQAPDLWTASLTQLTNTLQMAAGLIAERTGRDQDDWQVRALAGAVVGVMISLVPQWTEDPDTDVLASIDRALAFLEAGLPLDSSAADVRSTRRPPRAPRKGPQKKN